MKGGTKCWKWGSLGPNHVIFDNLYRLKLRGS